MLKIGTVEDAVAGHRRRFFTVEGGKFRGYTDFMFETEPGEGAQAYLVHQDPGWALPVHFHMQYQMQVIVGGSGTLGKRRVGPGSVHYAAPYSAYGPLTAGPHGLEYFTLRVLTDKGAWYMPESRPMMDATKRKDQATGDLPEGEWKGPTTLLPLRDDGVGAWAYRADAGDTVRCGEPVSTAGRFHVVLKGVFRHGGTLLPRHACVFWSPPDDAPAFLAEEDGSELVVVQFPAEAVHHHVPSEMSGKATQDPFTTDRGEAP
jgi:hypothetical protein